jgi:hypothetical protein
MHVFQEMGMDYWLRTSWAFKLLARLVHVGADRFNVWTGIRAIPPIRADNGGEP